MLHKHEVTLRKYVGSPFLKRLPYLSVMISNDGERD